VSGNHIYVAIDEETRSTRHAPMREKRRAAFKPSGCCGWYRNQLGSAGARGEAVLKEDKGFMTAIPIHTTGVELDESTERV
jgi:hypothetical protein